MKAGIEAKLAQLGARLEELNRLLAHERATADMDSYRRLTREHAELEPVVALYQERLQGQHDLQTGDAQCVCQHGQHVRHTIAMPPLRHECPRVRSQLPPWLRWRSGPPSVARPPPPSAPPD